MSHINIEEKIETLVKPIIQKLNYELYDVQFVKEGKEFYLRITIDSQNGIGTDDCEKVSRAIDNVIDEADYISESYYLEVSSPGLERILRRPEHFEKQINNLITVKLFKSVNGEKEFTGKLIKYDENVLQLQTDDEIIEIDFKNIALAKQYFE